MSDILIIRFSSLGDVAMTSAVVEALHRNQPDSNLYMLTKDVYTPLFTHDKRLHEVIGITGHESRADIIRAVGRIDFTAIVDLHASLRSRRVASFLSAPIKRTLKKHSMLRRLMVLTGGRYRRSFDVLGSYLDTVTEFVGDTRILPRLVVDPDADTRLDALLPNDSRPLVCFAPGARHAPKRWEPSGFASVADETARCGVLPVLIGDDSERAVAEEVSALMDERPLILTGELDIARTVACIARSRALVTNDSGPMHLAGALGVPFVAVFGPTHPDLGFVPGYPYGVVLHTGEPCSPCSVHGSKPCHETERRCMTAITPEMVLESLPPLP